jgi:hypothetical protein
LPTRALIEERLGHQLMHPRIRDWIIERAALLPALSQKPTCEDIKVIARAKSFGG